MNYYKKYRHRKRVVAQSSVAQYKRYHIYADAELTKDIEKFKKEMGQGDSKVFQDILNDFFLNRDCERRKAEMKGF